MTSERAAEAEPADALREAVIAYLDHMDKREPYANIRADIAQAGTGGPDFTSNDRHFDGDGCFAQMERAAARGEPQIDVERLARALFKFVHVPKADGGYTDVAARIAAEYGRLGSE